MVGIKNTKSFFFKGNSIRSRLFLTAAMSLLFALLFAFAPTKESTSWIHLETSKQQGYLGLSRNHPNQIKLKFNAEILKKTTISPLFSWGNLQILRNDSGLLLSLSGKNYLILTKRSDIEKLNQIQIIFHESKLTVINEFSDSSRILNLGNIESVFNSGYWRIHQENSAAVTSFSILPQAYRISNSNYRNICLIIVCLLNLYLIKRQRFDHNAK